MTDPYKTKPLNFTLDLLVDDGERAPTMVLLFVLQCLKTKQGCNLCTVSPHEALASGASAVRCEWLWTKIHARPKTKLQSRIEFWMWSFSRKNLPALPSTGYIFEPACGVNSFRNSLQRHPIVGWHRNYFRVKMTRALFGGVSVSTPKCRSGLLTP